MDGPAGLYLDRTPVVDRLSHQVEDPTQGLFADRHRDRLSSVEDGRAALDAIGRIQRHRADPAAAEL